MVAVYLTLRGVILFTGWAENHKNNLSWNTHSKKQIESETLKRQSSTRVNFFFFFFFSSSYMSARFRFMATPISFLQLPVFLIVALQFLISRKKKAIPPHYLPPGVPTCPLPLKHYCARDSRIVHPDNVGMDKSLFSHYKGGNVRIP